MARVDVNTVEAGLPHPPGRVSEPLYGFPNLVGARRGQGQAVKLRVADNRGGERLDRFVSALAARMVELGKDLAALGVDRISQLLHRSDDLVAV